MYNTSFKLTYSSFILHYTHIQNNTVLAVFKKGERSVKMMVWYITKGQNSIGSVHTFVPTKYSNESFVCSPPPPRYKTSDYHPQLSGTSTTSRHEEYSVYTQYVVYEGDGNWYIEKAGNIECKFRYLNSPHLVYVLPAIQIVRIASLTVAPATSFLIRLIASSFR